MKHSMSFQSFATRFKMKRVLQLLVYDHRREFENIDFEDYCNEHGINHNFLAPRTPQQNGVVERKNRTL